MGNWESAEMADAQTYIEELEAEVERLKAELAEWKPCPHCGAYTYRKLPEKQP